MTYKDSPVCYVCVHLRSKDEATCDAYPDGEGIPVNIWMENELHDKPRDGDHGIQFKLTPGKTLLHW